MATFGMKLRELREAAGLTQGQLAEAAGISRNSLIRLETDLAVPAWPTAMDLARALKVGVEVFPDVAPVLRTRKRPSAAESAPATKPRQNRRREK